MEFGNICLFPSYRTDAGALHPINLVRETTLLSQATRKESVYKLYFVESGCGVLRLRTAEYALRKGDLFFTFPGMPYTLSFEGEYSCIYLSFLGSRANQLLDQLGICETTPYYSDCSELYSHFCAALNMGRSVSGLMIESVLLYVFAFLGRRLLCFEDSTVVRDGAAQRIKGYIDENFADSSLSLFRIGEALSFHPKYVSSAFKKEMHLSICEYLTTLRIQHACTLMDKGYRSIAEIGVRCGFSDAQYFSKVFKKRMLQTPNEYIRSIK